MSTDHDCQQEAAIAVIETKLDSGADKFKEFSADLKGISTKVNSIDSRLSFLNGRVAAWGAGAGGVTVMIVKVLEKLF